MVVINSVITTIKSTATQERDVKTSLSLAGEKLMVGIHVEMSQITVTKLSSKQMANAVSPAKFTKIKHNALILYSLN